MSARPAIRIRRARVATGLLFLTNGALLANLIPRYPEIKTALGMSDSLFGLSVAAFPLGVMLFGVLAAGIIHRFGSGRIAALSTLVVELFLTLTVFMSDVHWFALALLIAGGSRCDCGCFAKRSRPRSPKCLRTISAKFISCAVVIRRSIGWVDGCGRVVVTATAADPSC